MEEKMKKFTVSDGDEIVITSCYFQIEDWSEGSPVVILEPCLVYREDVSCESLIEDFLEDLVCCNGVDVGDEEIVDEDLRWAGKSLKSVKDKVKKGLKEGKKPYKGTYSEIVQKKVQFFMNPNCAWSGEEGLDYKVMWTLTI